MYFCSFIIVLGCESWFLLWFGLEVNMISFISIIYSRSLMGVESCMKYFFVQSVGSGLLLASLYFDYEGGVNLVGLTLGYSMGAGPFFYWFPSVCEGIEWGSCLMLMTFQKIIPLILISLFMGLVVWVMIFISLIVGVMGSFNEKRLKKLLAYSSIHHLGWLMMSNYLSVYMWMYYWLGYFFMVVGLIMILNESFKLSINDLMRVDDKMILIFSMLNMGGMPPMFGFFLKWGIFYLLCWQMNMYLLTMIVLSVSMLYVYLRVVFGIMSGGCNFYYGVESVSFNISSLVSGGFLIISVIMGSFISLN